MGEPARKLDIRGIIPRELTTDPYLLDGLTELYLLLRGFGDRPAAIASCTEQAHFNDSVLCIKEVIQETHIRLIPPREEHIVAARMFVAMVNEAVEQVEASSFGADLEFVPGVKIRDKQIGNWRRNVDNINEGLGHLGAHPLSPSARVMHVEEWKKGIDNLEVE